jgi:hypothetical protein
MDMEYKGSLGKNVLRDKRNNLRHIHIRTEHSNLIPVIYHMASSGYSHVHTDIAAHTSHMKIAYP